MEIVSIIISVIAIIISIANLKRDKAKHNLHQLQENARRFCNNLNEFISLTTVHCLTSYKYEIENVYHITDYEKHSIAFNNLQIEFSKRKEELRSKYVKLTESIGFFCIDDDFNKNELCKWFNKVFNDYYLRLNVFYSSLFDINSFVYDNEYTLEYIDKFFTNIRDLFDYSMGFTCLKKDISDYFSRLSLSDVGLFGNTKKALAGIEHDIINHIKKVGFEDAIYKKDYTKIRKVCVDFADEFDSLIEFEKTNLMFFMETAKNYKQQSNNEDKDA